MNDSDSANRDFIRDVIRADLDAGRTASVVTRFPPEPNGYLHIGHAKSICLNFSAAQEFGGRCNLRFDDTNPAREEQEYIDAIQEDVRWLGFDWGEGLYFASDHFDQIYEWAEHLIAEHKAYVDDLSADEIRDYRGTLTEAGRESPYRNRTTDENLYLFREMKAGDFPDGAKVLRAKIDMAAGNINLRDPVLYRILHADHPRTGNKWCLYPTYDFAHGQSDAIEGVTHSICTLEFEDHRPLYDWLLDNLPVPSRPRQYEFARLNLTHTALSKRVLRRLVVVRPLKVVIENYPEGQSEELEAANNPAAENGGTRMVPFSRELYIERDDFMEDPPKKFFRLGPDREVRLRFAYFITCREIVKDAAGEVVELRCTYDPETRGGNAPDGRKVRGTIHWVSAEHALDAELRLYDHLFADSDPDLGDDLGNAINPASVEAVSGCKVEPSLAEVGMDETLQFERTGYFCLDSESAPGKLVFNRTIGLRDSWAKVVAKGG